MIDTVFVFTWLSYLRDVGQVDYMGLNEIIDAAATCVLISQWILASAASMTGGYEGDIVGCTDRCILYIITVTGCTAVTNHGHGSQLVAALTSDGHIANDAGDSKEINYGIPGSHGASAWLVFGHNVAR